MTGPERRMAKILDELGLTYWPQHKVGRHSIDYVLPSEKGSVLLQVNGAWWHAKQKIIQCDKVALNRLLGEGYLVLGLWDSTPKDLIIRAIGTALRDRRLLVWHWNVPIEELIPEAQETVRRYMGEPVQAGRASRTQLDLGRV